MPKFCKFTTKWSGRISDSYCSFKPLCLCSVVNGTCAGSGRKISSIAQLHKRSLKSWFHTGSGSPSFALTCMTCFTKLAFSNALRFPKAQDQGKSKIARLHKQSLKSWYTELSSIGEVALAHTSPTLHPLSLPSLTLLIDVLAKKKTKHQNN